METLGHDFRFPGGAPPKPLIASERFGVGASSVSPRGEVAIPANVPIDSSEDEAWSSTQS